MKILLFFFNKKSTTIQKLQSTKAMKYVIKAGLLTYSLFSCLPILLNSDFVELKKVIELTAAGQFQIYTRFPFNSSETR
jgi:hypothetical protein